MSGYSTASDGPVDVISMSSDGSDDMPVDSQSTDNVSGSSHYWNVLDSFYVLFDPTPANLERYILIVTSEVSPGDGVTSSSSDGERIPITFYLIIHPFNEDAEHGSLKLPFISTTYFNYMNANMPLNTSLIDVLKSTTQATLRMKDGRVEICDSWTMFYEEHGLRRRDMLYFTMFEDLSMEVKIYCPCGGGGRCLNSLVVEPIVTSWTGVVAGFACSDGIQPSRQQISGKFPPPHCLILY
ncbi:hypothetical protein COLO4_07423 [Corchorus olitorius]|uniref:TF-B3 domain-containing protein n=1 Tax=Corchorus olitorius TaxID=93759 RepID=A0A1R3KJW7_9ROSI|nr:hypothetical protein COLO4_07423 [Corchorus olitorius]